MGADGARVRRQEQRTRKVNTMRVDEPSRTIGRPAIMRAAHQLLDEPPLILADPIAVGLIDAASNEAILNHRDELQTDRAKHLRSLFVMRSRFAEDELARVRSDGVTQYAILGAGLDTFALRQPTSVRKLRIFELDWPATQLAKLERLRELALPVPSNVFHVPGNLDGNGWMAALEYHGLDVKAPCFFSCLGVSQYLNLEAVDRIFGFVASLPRKSAIVCSFVQLDADLTGEDFAESQASAAMGQKIGEPWLTRFNPAALSARLRDRGYIDVHVLDPEEGQCRYFEGRRDGLHAPRFELVLSAAM